MLLPPTVPVGDDSDTSSGSGSGDQENGVEGSKHEESGEKKSAESQLGEGEDSPGTVRFLRRFFVIDFLSFF